MKNATWIGSKLKKSIIPMIGAVALALGMGGVAQAVPVTFFGEDLGLGEGTRLPAHPNADAARNAFMAMLIGVGTETFEGYAHGTGTPLGLTFPGAGAATLNGAGYVYTQATGTNGVGRYPISGDNYWEASTSFSISFSDPIAAFGFYGIDIGDYQGQVTLTLTSGATTTLTVPNTMGGYGGGVLYFGVIDVGDPFTMVTFGNTAAGTDYFGFDDMTIGSVKQVGGAIPEPSTVLLLGAGLAGLGLWGRKRMKKA